MLQDLKYIGDYCGGQEVLYAYAVARSYIAISLEHTRPIAFHLSKDAIPPREP
jgi:hypothetical protein